MDGNTDRGPFERTVWFAFGASAAMLVAVTALAAVVLLRTVSSKDEVIFNLGQDLYEMERLRLDTEREIRSARTWLVTHDRRERDALPRIQQEIDERLRHLDDAIADPDTEHLLQQVTNVEQRRRAAIDEVLAGASTRPPSETSRLFEANVVPLRTELDDEIELMVQHQRAVVSDAIRASEKDARWALILLVSAAALCALGAIALGILLTRALRTQQRQRQELERNVERVAEANRDLEAFAGRLSHDLRNMLSPAVLATSRLKRAGPKLEAAGVDAVTVARLESSLTRTLRAMEGLLAFSRAGQPADPLATSDVQEVLAGVVEEVQPLRADVDATVAVHFHGPMEVRCGAALLHVILANLVGNALKYISGRPRREVQVRADGGPEWTTISVEDTGPGIGAEQLSRIFEAFYRVPGQSIAGTGIGLATVKRIVEAHGGHVQVTSEVGRGTLFTVVLPSAGGHLPDTHDETDADRRH